jgi:hypothetical protein
MNNDEQIVVKRRGKSIPLRKPLSQEIKKSIFMLIFTLLAIIVLVSIVYLLNSSQTTQKGYSLRQQQLEKDLLIEESNQWVHKIIQAQSFQGISDNELVKKMVQIEKPIYLEKQ